MHAGALTEAFMQGGEQQWGLGARRTREMGAFPRYPTP